MNIDVDILPDDTLVEDSIRMGWSTEPDECLAICLTADDSLVVVKWAWDTQEGKESIVRQFTKRFEKVLKTELGIIS